jgi:accessory gene regulator protein AgrB
MEPLVNPWLFYLVNLSHGLKIFFIVAGGVAGIVAIFAGGSALDDDFNTPVEIAKFKKICRKYIILALILFFIAILIPSKEVCYQMLVASLVTPDNLKVAGQTAQDIINYIVNAASVLIGQ